ncbi:hypothetical protein D3C73_1248420 [compost metagenome]
MLIVECESCRFFRTFENFLHQLAKISRRCAVGCAAILRLRLRRDRHGMQRGDLLGGDAQYQQGVVHLDHHHALTLTDLATGPQV